MKFIFNVRSASVVINRKLNYKHGELVNYEHPQLVKKHNIVRLIYSFKGYGLWRRANYYILLHEPNLQIFGAN